MKFRRNLLSRIYRNSDPDADSGGGGSVVDTTPQPNPSAVDAGAAPEQAQPGTMLEAMFGQKPAEPTEAEAQEAAAAGKTVQQLRDEKGRFAGKVTTDPTQPEAVKPPVKTDPTQMPEGLTPKAQERFQALANTNKELTARVSEWEPIVQSAQALQQTFHENGIRREQFEQAMQVVGLMNRGDLRGALAALDEQRRLISLHLGQPLPGADALADHPDLRAEVDNLQITEQRALEIARSRLQQSQWQQQSQRQQQENQQHQQEQQRLQQEHQARNDSMLAVDRFCKQMQTSDLDYARIEPILLKQIEDGLLEGVPFAARPALVQKTYALIKQTAASSRTAGQSTAVLRPTGGESPRQAPKTMHEAMWGTKA